MLNTLVLFFSNKQRFKKIIYDSVALYFITGLANKTFKNIALLYAHYNKHEVIHLVIRIVF